MGYAGGGGPSQKLRIPARNKASVCCWDTRKPPKTVAWENEQTCDIILASNQQATRALTGKSCKPPQILINGGWKTEHTVGRQRSIDNLVGLRLKSRAMGGGGEEVRRGAGAER
jgi:hypothetical protein